MQTTCHNLTGYMENTITGPVTSITNKYTNQATRMAARSSAKIRMASVIVRGGSVIAWANNGSEENEHAELRALRRASYELKRGGTIYVARLKFDGSLGMAMPCAMCWANIKNRKIKTIVWSTDGQTFDRCHVDNTPHENDSIMPFISCGMELPESYRLLYAGVS